MKKITKTIKNNAALLPVIKNLTALNFNQADIGLLLGYAGKDAASWFKRFRKKFPDVESAWQAGKDLADVELVTSATRLAFGYDFQEKETSEEYDQYGKMVKKIERVKDKTKHADPQMLKFLLINRLPEFFQEKKNVNFSNSKYVKGNIKEEIAVFAGKLLKSTETDNKPEKSE